MRCRAQRGNPQKEGLCVGRASSWGTAKEAMPRICFRESYSGPTRILAILTHNPVQDPRMEGTPSWSSVPQGILRNLSVPSSGP